MSALPWFKCCPEDWLNGTRNLTPEQRGVYFDCLCLIYQFEKPLPNDDKWMSHALHISTRLWRSIRDALIACGKLVETPDGLTNVRAQFELGSRSVQVRTKPESSANISKNQMNSTRARALNKTETGEDRRRRKEERKEDSQSSSEASVQAQPQPAGWQDLKTAFNGSTEALLDDVQKFMGPIADRECAVKWLTGMLSAVGQSRVLEAWQIIVSKQGRGEIVGNPIALWSKTARGLKETPAGAKPIDRANMRFMPSRYGPGKWVPIEGAVQ
jgi:uncharacterized protein YdaU (DUF1376 family)